MRLTPLTPDTAQGKAKEALTDIYERHGSAGPMVRAMANSPALLRGYLDLSRAIKRVKLERTLAERISIAIQQQVGCDYCLAAHTRAGRELGLDESELARARSAESDDPRVEAMLRFAVRVYRDPAGIDDDEVEQLREYGYSEREIADVVGLVALNLLTGSFNLVAGLHAAEEGLADLPDAVVSG